MVHMEPSGGLAEQRASSPHLEPNSLLPVLVFSGNTCSRAHGAQFDCRPQAREAISLESHKGFGQDPDQSTFAFLATSSTPAVTHSSNNGTSQQTPAFAWPKNASSRPSRSNYSGGERFGCRGSGLWSVLSSPSTAELHYRECHRGC